MTTSEPRTPHDDTPREHRRLGQRILDAVLGDPADTQRDDPADTRRADPVDTRRADPGRTEGRTGAEGFAGDGPRGEYSSSEQAMRERAVGGVVQDDRAAGLGYAAPTKDPGDMVADVRDEGQPGHAGRTDAVRDAGAAAYDDRRDAGDARGDAAQPGYADQRAAGRADTAEAPWDSGYDQPGTRAGTAPDATHDLPRPGAGTAGDDRDLVTSSYDPDRDAGYDPQTAGTAMGSAAGAGARTVADRDTRGGADYDTARDTGYVDDPRSGGTRDYDPAQDTGYVDAGRADVDRTTGRRDDDFDTGRVDADRDRLPTEPVDDTHRGVGTAAGVAGAGAVAAATFRGDTDRDRDTERDARFSAVDDTATVDNSDTGRSTPETAVAGNGRGEAGVADDDGASGTRERLVPTERAEEYGSRWDALKGDFVDEPRRAVRQADELVGELLDELQRLFADQRRNLEQGFDHDQASTEDLRLALRRYRSFFDRLLSF